MYTFEELVVGAYLLLVWRRINDASLSRWRRKATLVAAVMDQLESDVLLRTLQDAARPAGRPLRLISKEDGRAVGEPYR